ncbi:MAG: GNAT family N-acetyltransferase [Alphaproteobacteria bacterium]|nr:GNAT family N-acetyltransferase [Alphaproteobacteria bacterium]
MTKSQTLQIVPASEASFDDMRAFFAARGYHRNCWCQRFKTPCQEWYKDPLSAEARPDRFRAQAQCDTPGATATSGLVAYHSGAVVGWCAVEPRSAYIRLGQTPWKGRKEDKADDAVWAATCFVVHKKFRRQRITYALARAAVDHARRHGARALEGYPMITTPGTEITWGELHVGSRSIFAAAGFTEVSRPSKRRVVMRIEFE